MSGLGWPGRSAELLDAVADGRLELITSRALLDELERVLGYRRLVPLLGQVGLKRGEVTELVARTAIVVQPGDPVSVARDIADNRVLEAAVAGEADMIVTGDDDLLSLGSFEGIEIMTAREALTRLG